MVDKYIWKQVQTINEPYWYAVCNPEHPDNGLTVEDIIVEDIIKDIR